MKCSKLLVFINICLFASGCNDSNSSADTGSSATSPPPMTQASPLLADHNAGKQANFSQFKQKSIVIDIEQYEFSASVVYAKVYIDKNNVLFLGAINTNQKLKLHVPNSINIIHFDLFSGQVEDQQISGVISL